MLGSRWYFLGYVSIQSLDSCTYITLLVASYKFCTVNANEFGTYALLGSCRFRLCICKGAEFTSKNIFIHLHTPLCILVQKPTWLTTEWPTSMACPSTLLHGWHHNWQGDCHSLKMKQANPLPEQENSYNIATIDRWLGRSLNPVLSLLKQVL